MRYTERTAGAALALGELSLVFRLPFAGLAEMQGAHIAHVGDLGAAVHAFPDNCLLFIVDTASFLSEADLFQQTSHAVNFLVSLALFIISLSLTVDQSSKEGLQTGLTLIVGAALHGVLLRLLEEGIIRVT